MFGLIFTITIAMGIPIAGLVYAIIQKRWLPFILGALAFVISQMVLRIPLMQILEQHSISYVMFRVTNPILFSILLGLSAGIFEEIARYLMIRFFMKQRDFKSGLLFGAGHGGIEAILLVGINAIFLLFSSPAIMESSMYFVGGVERFFAMALHIGLSLIVLRGVVSKQFRYVLLAIIIHGLVDALVGILPLYLSPNISLIVLETTLAFTSVGVLLYGWSIKKRGVLD